MEDSRANIGVRTPRAPVFKQVINTKIAKQSDIERLVNDAWLDLDVNEEDLYNPIQIIPRAFDEDPQVFLTYIMSHPYYLSIFCKEIMNITIFPMQGMMLQELWKRKFPILLGARGLSKTFTIALYSMLRAIFLPGRKIVVTAASFRQSKLVFMNCETIWRGAPLLRDLIGNGKRDDQILKHDSSEWVFNIGESTIAALPMGDGCQVLTTQVLTSNGFRTFSDFFTETNIIKDESEDNSIWGNSKFRLVDSKHYNGLSQTKKITTATGYQVEATLNHKYKTLTTSGIEWKETRDISDQDYLLIDRSNRWHSGEFQCTKDEAYTLGAMIANGCWTGEYKLGFATTDMEVMERIRNSGIPFKQENDLVHFSVYKREYKDTFLSKWGLEVSYSHEKKLPNNILSSTKENMRACLQGLFDCDGTFQSSTAKGGVSLCIGYSTTSEILARQMQFILLHFGIISSLTSRKRPEGENWHRVYELRLNGLDAIKFSKDVGFYTSIKQKPVEEAISRKKRFFSIGDIVPFYKDKIVLLRGLFKGAKIKSAKQISRKKNITTKSGLSIIEQATSRGISDSLLEELRPVFNPDFFYDRVYKIEDSESLTYDIQVPEGNEYCANGLFSHNSTIRGKRSNDTICEEFASVNRHVFENVVGGFGVVAQNPVQKIREEAKQRKRQELGLEAENVLHNQSVENQTLISGTCYYQFNHFYEYFRKYRDIIRSMGDVNKLKNIVGEEAYNPDFNWQNYSIIRIPYQMLPRGYFDPQQISRARVSSLPSNFLCEYGACFPADSDGFFKRTLLEACIPNDQNEILIGGKKVEFLPSLTGNPHSRYVFAIDPASEEDNFALVIIELREDHKRIVYCWTTNKRLHRRNLSMNQTREDNYWAFCVRKVRNLMRRFPCDAIVVDSQGGGNAVREAFSDKDKLELDEGPIWPIMNPVKPEYSDTQVGKHIIHMVNFASNEWLGNAYFNTKKDMEEKLLLFPSFDGATMGLTECNEMFIEGGLEDNMENLIEEIEELKNELTCIIHTKLPSGRDQFTVPDIKTAEGKKARVKKDRASALIMCNSVARSIMRDYVDTTYESNGGFAIPSKTTGGAMYSNPWYSNIAKDAYADY